MRPRKVCQIASGDGSYTCLVSFIHAKACHSAHAAVILIWNGFELDKIDKFSTNLAVEMVEAAYGFIIFKPWHWTQNIHWDSSNDCFKGKSSN